MKLYQEIDPRKEPQPDYWWLDLWVAVHIFLNLQYLRHYNKYSKKWEETPIVFYNWFLLDKAIEQNIIYYSTNLDRQKDWWYIEYSKPYIEKHEKLKKYVEDNDNKRKIINWLNAMLRNHIRKHNLYEIDYDIVKPSDLKNMPYDLYLKTEYRLKMRSIALSLYWKKCKICNSEDNINLHHRTYKNRWNYMKEIDDIIPLCRSCHSKFHDK